MKQIPFAAMWFFGVLGAWLGILIFRILKRRK